MNENLTSILARIAVTLILSGVTFVVACAKAVRWVIGRSPKNEAAHAGPRHVVMVGTFYNAGWFRSHVTPLSVCESIDRITVICDEPLFDMPKVQYVCPPRWRVRIFGRALARLLTTFSMARKNRPDVLIGYHIMPNALICLTIARCLGLKAIYQMTGGPLQLIGGGVESENSLLRRQIHPSRLREWLMFHLAKQFDAVIVRGEKAKKFFADLRMAEKTTIIPGSVDTGAYYKSKNPPAYDLIAVGRLVEVKRYDRLLRIVAELVKLRPDTHVAIVGDGPLLESTQRQATKLGIAAHVDFLGQREDVAALLSRARVFILTSQNEAMSIAMMEAMAAGLPAITPDVGEHRDLVQAGVTGLFIDANDAPGAAQFIADLLSNDEKLSQMSSAARRIATDFAGIESLAVKWDGVLTKLFGVPTSRMNGYFARQTSSVASHRFGDAEYAAGTNGSHPHPGSNGNGASKVNGRYSTSHSPARPRWGTACKIFAAALAARLLFCFGLVMTFGLPMGPNRIDFYNSTDGYINIAENIVDHGNYAFTADGPPTTYRAPVYPLALAAAYKLVGDPARAVLWVNCIASSLTCVLVYLIAVRLIGHRATFWMLAPVTFFPLSIYYCTSSFSDTFVAFTFVLYVYATMALFTAPTTRRGISGGIAFAIGALTKSTLLPIPFLLWIYAALRRRAALRPVAIAMLVGFALTGIWTLRNLRVSGHLIPITGGTGYNMLVGNYMIDAGGDCDASLAHGRAEAIQRVNADTGRNITNDMLRPTGFLDVPHDIDKLYMKSAVKMFTEEPALIFNKLAVNSTRFWYFSSSRMKSLANGIVNAGTLLLALLALPRLWRERKTEIEIMGLILFAVVLLYAAIIVHSSRFCLPVVMPLLPLATMTAIDLRNRRRAEVPATMLVREMVQE